MNVRALLRLCLCSVLVAGAIAHESTADDGRKPDFAVRDVDGVTRRLSDHRGKWVVLEWVNFDCGPVKELYEAPARKVQSLQTTYAAKGVVWFSINSAAVGKPGYLSPAQCKTTLERLGAKPTAFLLDTTGTAAKAFEAQLTPEVRVVSPRGDVVYAGGVAGTDARDRYLETVLAAATSGRPVPFARKPARGCKIEGASSAPTFTGPKASDFKLTDTSGVSRRLSDYRGRWVILEWVNYDCPFVKKHYHSSHRSMQKLQARAARNGIVWLQICSSAPGKEGHFSSAQANARMRSLGATPTAYLHDPSGSVGIAYGAKTTPDMRVISPEGTIEYTGGIDSIQSMRASDVSRAKNYVRLAIADIEASRPIGIKSSRPYGCSVKYR